MAKSDSPVAVHLPGTSNAHNQRIAAYALTILAAEVSRRGLSGWKEGTVRDVKALAKLAVTVFDNEAA